MKPEIIELIGNVRKRRSQKFRNQLSVFFMCLLVTIFLWVLIKLSRDYNYTIEYNLNFTHIPPSYRLIYASDSILTLNLRVQGYDLFTDMFFRSETRSYNLDLTNIKVKSTGTKSRGYMLTNDIGNEITSRSRFQNHLLSMAPDTIHFEFERRR